MDFNTAAASIWQQIVTVYNAPVPFLAVVVLMWFVMRWAIGGQYATRLSNAESTEKLLERQLQEYKDKTGSDTPDAVKARIDALEQRISEMVPRLAAMGPRKISAEQRQVMVPLLDPFKGQSIDITSDAASTDAAQMSKGLVAAFNSAGWITQTPMVMGLGNPPTTGVGVKVGDPNSLTPAQKAVVNALRAANISFDFQTGPLHSRRPQMLGHPESAPPVAEVILTTRLED
ncbi:hypothetical protein OVY48_09665 [Sphingobium sp. SA2]|uniref:hypothetical protein n=1 Tax=Sphingobium sp. SA2 TaxID=1524832 RepID=UPI0028C0FA39|nr:hypothetical protein [Sphingobium sp. SA2]MDT7533689.1 hypothetical protein [Sphingobium sp. SA2]